MLKAIHAQEDRDAASEKARAVMAKLTDGVSSANGQM